MKCLAFVWVSLVFLYIWYKYIYKYKLLYIAFWAIAACLWVPTLPKRFLFSVWTSWWIHDCFCLMKANSCNMQELWPGNKNYCTCASCVVLPGRAAGDQSLVRPSAPSGTQPLHVVLLRQKNIVIGWCEMNAAIKGNVPPVDQSSMMSQRGQRRGRSSQFWPAEETVAGFYSQSRRWGQSFPLGELLAPLSWSSLFCCSVISQRATGWRADKLLEPLQHKDKLHLILLRR